MRTLHAIRKPRPALCVSFLLLALLGACAETPALFRPMRNAPDEELIAVAHLPQPPFCPLNLWAASAHCTLGGVPVECESAVCDRQRREEIGRIQEARREYKRRHGVEPPDSIAEALRQK